MKSSSHHPVKPRARSAAAIRLAARAAGAHPVESGSASAAASKFTDRAPAARADDGRAPELERPRLVVFIGVGEIGHAQIAATWFPTLAAATKARAIFASLGAAAPLSPEVVEALQEVGLDAGRPRARVLTRELTAAADLIVTIAGTSGRADVKLPGKARRREHWFVPGAPGETGLSRARSLREALRARVAMLAFMEGWGRPEISREAARVTRARPLGIDGHRL